MSKPTRRPQATVIDLRQKHGPLASYWTATVRRGKKGPILFENSDASRGVALSGAESRCRRLGYQVKIQES